MDTRLFRRLFWITISAVLLVAAAFFFWGVSRQQPEIAPAPTPDALPVTKRQQSEIVAAPAPIATPIPKRFAPAGVLYLTKRATVTSASGITGIPVGAEVKVVGPENGGNIPVEYKGNKLLLPASQLTSDLNLVDSLTMPAASSTPTALPPAPQQPCAATSEPPAPEQEPLPATPKSFIENITGRISLWWQNLCDWVNPPPPPPPPPPPTPATRVEEQHQQQQVQQAQKKIENTAIFHKSEHQWIAFHERSIRDLEKKLIGRTDASGINMIQNQIAENRIRIAKIKAKIGE